MPRLQELRNAARARLREAAISQPEASADLLLARALGRDLAWLYAHPEAEIPPEAGRLVDGWLEQRAQGTPAQYLTGVQEFFGREFAVTSAVLIPRPETELVVEAALELALTMPSPQIVDVGTGSGCIAITLALELVQRRHPARLWGVDLSESALRVAERNAARLQAEVAWLHGDLMAPWLAAEAQRRHSLPRQLDLIVSNPPYIAESELESLPPEVQKYEPRSALIAGPSGTEIYARLLPQAFHLLRPGGGLVLELGYNTAGQLLPALRDWELVEIKNDLQGLPRVLRARRPGHAGGLG